MISIAMLLSLVSCTKNKGKDKEKQTIEGIDVSIYQGLIDWKKVASSGIEFAYIRLGYRGYTEGVLQMDKNFELNVKGALENGIEVGVYFVTQAISEEEAKEEAEYVLDAIKDYDISWPIAYDIEGNSNEGARANNNTRDQNTKNVIAFCETIKDAGHDPMIYSNSKWFVTKMDMSQLTDYKLWYALYGSTQPSMYDFYIWQYSNTGQVNGINGLVDLNKVFIEK